jgi:ATP synthase protein I
MLRAAGQPASAAMTERGGSAPQPPSHASDGWRIFSYMIGGMAFYGGLGWLIGHFTGVSILFPVGMLLGLGLSLLMVIFRFSRS